VSAFLLNQGSSAPKNCPCAVKLQKILQEKSFYHHPEKKQNKSVRKIEKVILYFHIQGRSCNIRANRKDRWGVLATLQTDIRNQPAEYRERRSTESLFSDGHTTIQWTPPTADEQRMNTVGIC